MIEIMQFIFSSFWIWLGTVMLVYAPFLAIAAEITAARTKTKGEAT